MRRAFVQTLVELAREDPNIVLLTGDLGYLVVEPFMQAFPERFFNVGVAEQNMVGLATGMAEAGFRPFVYSIAPFAALRPYEFIRNGPVHHRWPVRVVGTGGGFEYGINGPSHFALEDVGVMRLQPEMAVIAPAEPEQARQALLQTWDLPGPVYYRLGKDESATVPGLAGRFRLGRVETVRQGSDCALIALGAMSRQAVVAAEVLEREGIQSSVVVMASVAPAPIEDLVALLGSVPVAVTVEAHYLPGAVGSLVSEVVAEHGLRCRVRRCGVARLPGGRVGDQLELETRHGLASESVVEAVRAALAARAPAGS